LLKNSAIFLILSIITIIFCTTLSFLINVKQTGIRYAFGAADALRCAGKTWKFYETRTLYSASSGVITGKRAPLASDLRQIRAKTVLVILTKVAAEKYSPAFVRPVVLRDYAGAIIRRKSEAAREIPGSHV
jgi:hypothetical protein